MDEQGYTTIGSVTPDALEDEDKGVTAYAYAMAQGFTLILYESNETKELTHMYMAVDKDTICTEDITFFAFVSALEINWLEGKNGNSIISELELTTISKDHINTVDGKFSYSYIVSGSQIKFSAIPA